MRHDFGSTSSVRSADFDETTGAVDVEFSGGDKKKHSGFTAAEFAAWCADPKPGKWYAENVRKRADIHPEIKLAPEVERGVARTEVVEPPSEAASPAPPAVTSTAGTDVPDHLSEKHPWPLVRAAIKRSNEPS